MAILNAGHWKQRQCIPSIDFRWNNTVLHVVVERMVLETFQTSAIGDGIWHRNGHCNVHFRHIHEVDQRRYLTSMRNAIKPTPLLTYIPFLSSVFFFASSLPSAFTWKGSSTQDWVPVVCLLLYVCFSMVGLLTIPWTMTAELFPSEIRGVAHSISYSMANILMFCAIQVYR